MPANADSGLTWASAVGPRWNRSDPAASRFTGVSAWLQAANIPVAASPALTLGSVTWFLRTPPRADRQLRRADGRGTVRRNDVHVRDGRQIEPGRHDDLRAASARRELPRQRADDSGGEHNVSENIVHLELSHVPPFPRPAARPHSGPKGSPLSGWDRVIAVLDFPAAMPHE